MATEPMNTAQTNPQNNSDVKIPEDALIIIPVRDMVLFPGAIAPIAIARPKSVAAAQQALREQRPVGIVLQRSPETEEPGPDDLYRVATIANIVRYITAPDGRPRLVPICFVVEGGGDDGTPRPGRPRRLFSDRTIRMAPARSRAGILGNRPHIQRSSPAEPASCNPKIPSTGCCLKPWTR